MRATTLRNLFAAIVITTGFTACHSHANDNTSRAGVNDENGNNVANSEIEQNFAPGSDCDPNNDMYDGISGNMKKSEAGEGQEKKEEHNENAH